MENAYTLESIEVFQKAWNTGKKAKSKSEVLGLSFSFTTSGKSEPFWDPVFSPGSRDYNNILQGHGKD